MCLLRVPQWVGYSHIHLVGPDPTYNIWLFELWYLLHQIRYTTKLIRDVALHRSRKWMDCIVCLGHLFPFLFARRCCFCLRIFVMHFTQLCVNDFFFYSGISSKFVTGGSTTLPDNSMVNTCLNDLLYLKCMSINNVTSYLYFNRNNKENITI